MTEYIKALQALNTDKDRLDLLLKESNELCALADTQGRDDVIDWIKKNMTNLPYFNEGFKDQCAQVAIEQGDTEKLRWFSENGCNLGHALTEAINFKSPTCVDELLKLGADPNSIFKHEANHSIIRTERKGLTGFIKTNAIGLALERLGQNEPQIKIIHLLLINGAKLDEIPIRDIGSLLASKFFNTDDKGLQMLASTKLLSEFDKRPDCAPHMKEFSKLFIEAVKKVDIEEFPSAKGKIKEALRLVSTKFRESDPELSAKAEELIFSTQHEKNKIKACFHLQNALSALGGSAPELSTEIEGILRKLQTQSISQDIAKGDGTVRPTSHSYVAREDERRKSQQEEKLSSKGSWWNPWR